MIIEKFIEPVNYGHWGRPALNGFIYKDILDERIHINLKKEVKNILINSSKATFLTNGTIIYQDDKKIKIGANHFNNRYQNVIYDLSYDKEYWYQTVDTVYDWGYNIINKSLSPNFLKFFQVIKNVEPFNSNVYLPYRLHLNYLTTNEGLSLHLDGGALLYKNESKESRQISLTYYMEDHKEGLGGELYTVNGFTYKPQKNSAIAMNGHQVPHAVTHNMDTEPRLAFTIRWAHIDDLFLPGHPDKHLYKIDHL